MTRKEQTSLEMARGAHVIAKAGRESLLEKWHKERKIKVIPFLRFNIKEEGDNHPCPGTIFDTSATTTRPARDPSHTTVQVGDVFFNEPAVEYPSEVLFAKVALALQAGVGLTLTDADVPPWAQV